MTMQEQYVSSVRQAQETWSGVAESFTENLQKSFGQVGTFSVVDPYEAIDQLFDFWTKTLEVQRDVTKQLIGATMAVSDKVRSQAESIGAAVREQGESMQQSVRQQVESVQEAAHTQAVKKYDDLTKVELQEELASRDLPKTGNVDELRERLVADDQN